MLPFESFEADGMKIQNSGTWSVARKGVLAVKLNEHAVRRTMDQLKLGLEHCHASAFGAD